MLRRNLVLVERVPLVIEDRVQRLQVGRAWVESGPHVLRLDVDDGPTMAGGGHHSHLYKVL